MFVSFAINIMDSLDLLAREDEFKKLNKQLEKKTESLMKQIEHAMHKQDFFNDFSHSLSLTPAHTFKKHLQKSPVPSEPTTPLKTHKNLKKTFVSEKSNPKKPLGLKAGPLNVYNKTNKEDGPPYKETDDEGLVQRVVCDCCVVKSEGKERNEDMEFLHAFVSVGVQDKVLPQSFMKEAISVESICKFLASKVRLMQEQIDTLQGTIDKKAAQCKVHLHHQAELESERLTLLNKTNSLQATAADAKAKCMAVEQRLVEKDRMYKEQRSESDKLSCEVKRLKSEYAGVCSRIAAQAEAISTLTQQLKTAKAEHLEFRDSTRTLSTSNQAAITVLEKRVQALNATIDKQCSLIDNLRKQNAILKTDAALRALERDYSNFLNQDL